jgi:hypothetical protein
VIWLAASLTPCPRMQENIVFEAFRKGNILTFGSDELTPDVEWEWRRRLRKGMAIKPTGWHSTIALEAFVIPIKGAANAESKGLLHPLLRR